MRARLSVRVPKLPDRHTAERHWRRRRFYRSFQAWQAGCRIGTQPKGIGDRAPRSRRNRRGGCCRIGTQPKGIGDALQFVLDSGEVVFDCRIGTQPKGIGDRGHPLRERPEDDVRCRIGTQPKGIGDWMTTNGVHTLMW